jgi:hypothetical protein
VLLGMELQFSILIKDIKHGEGMKYKLPKKNILILSLGGLIIFLYWMLAPCSFYPKWDGNVGLPPSPVAQVWPQDRISFACYYLTNVSPWSEGRGIGVSVSGLKLLETEFPIPNQVKDNKELEPYAIAEKEHPPEERVILFVDKQQIMNTSKKVDKYGSLMWNPEIATGLSGGYYLSWLPPLSFGDHTAKLVLITLSGEEIEYEWQFKIVFR